MHTFEQASKRKPIMVREKKLNNLLDLFVYLNSLLFPASERYSQGIKYTFQGTDNFFGISLQDSTLSYDNRLRGDDDADDMAVDDEGYGFVLVRGRCVGDDGGGDWTGNGGPAR